MPRPTWVQPPSAYTRRRRRGRRRLLYDPPRLRGANRRRARVRRCRQGNLRAAASPAARSASSPAWRSAPRSGFSNGARSPWPSRSLSCSATALTSLPLLRAGLALGAVITTPRPPTRSRSRSWRSSTTLFLLVSRARSTPGLATLLFGARSRSRWRSPFVVAVPVNRWLIARGKGHAAVHAPASTAARRPRGRRDRDPSRSCSAPPSSIAERSTSAARRWAAAAAHGRSRTRRWSWSPRRTATGRASAGMNRCAVCGWARYGRCGAPRGGPMIWPPRAPSRQGGAEPGC